MSRGRITLPSDWLTVAANIDQVAIQGGKAFVFDASGALEVVNVPERGAAQDR